MEKKLFPKAKPKDVNAIITAIHVPIRYVIKFINNPKISQLQMNGMLVENNTSSHNSFEGDIIISTELNNFNLLITGFAEGKMSSILGEVELFYKENNILKYQFNKKTLTNFFSIIIQDISIIHELSFDYKFKFPSKRIFASPYKSKMITEYQTRLVGFEDFNIEPNLELDIEDFDSAKSNGGGEQILFYGTTRKKTGNAELNKFYGAGFDDLHLGCCKVNIPHEHLQGDLERPFKLLWFSFKENAGKHITINDIQELEESNFYRWLNKGIAESNSKSSLIFIHGYNTTFSEAAWRTAQIAHDIPFNGITGFFSWNSAGDLLDYFSDIESADSNIKLLEKFIEDILIKTEVENLHFIAHSMGNRILTQALINLSANKKVLKNLKSINQIILAAPDIDKDVFNSNILPNFINIGKRRTLYSSDKDKALRFSKLIRRGKVRIGESGKKLYVANGLDTVDASNVMSEGNNHSYMFEAKELLIDLYFILNQGLEPVKRRLTSRPHKGLKYWLFLK